MTVLLFFVSLYLIFEDCLYLTIFIFCDLKNKFISGDMLCTLIQQKAESSPEYNIMYLILHLIFKLIKIYIYIKNIHFVKDENNVNF